MAYRIRLEGKNKIIAERMLKDIVKICEKCGINYTLEAGTLLGIFREQRLLPWDNDIDISVLSNETNKFKKLFNLLKVNNYRVRVRYFNYDKPPFKRGDIRLIKIREKYFFGLIKGPVCFEIFILYSMKKRVYWKVGSRIASVPDKFFKSVSKINFQNYNYNIPKLTVEYLKYRYGNWKKQVKNWDSMNDDLSLH